MRYFFRIFSVTFCVVISFYLISCKSDITAPNPYGSGMGRVTFYKTSNVVGGVSIVINSQTIVDKGVWSSVPDCDDAGAANFILSAGSYTATLTGMALSCTYHITITEGQCNLINYTSCTSPLPCLSSLDGTWTKIGDGSIPHSSGMRINFSGGVGTVISVFTGNDVFCVGDVKWKNFSNLNCTIQDLLPSSGCAEQNYTSSAVTVNSPNSITIAGQNYAR